jgi:hypothetical protein
MGVSPGFPFSCGDGDKKHHSDGALSSTDSLHTAFRRPLQTAKSRNFRDQSAAAFRVSVSLRFAPSVARSPPSVPLARKPPCPDPVRCQHLRNSFLRSSAPRRRHRQQNLGRILLQWFFAVSYGHDPRPAEVPSTLPVATSVPSSASACGYLRALPRFT